MKVNRTYKDSVFSKYFTEDTRRLVELYNAITGEDYSLDAEIKLNTLDGVLFKDRMNDISFLLENQVVVLMEHQSTQNENMPLRMLIYAARLYEQILDSDSIYSTERVMIPTPKVFVFYNGEHPRSVPETCWLSDSYLEKPSTFVLDLAVQVYNINYDSGIEALQKCKSLWEYSCFIHCAREAYRNGASREEAIVIAIRQCIQNNIMREFLKQHGSEVENMLFTEWNMDRALDVRDREAVARTNIKFALQLLRDGESTTKVCRYTNLSEEAVNALSPVVHGGDIDGRKINALTGISVETIQRLVKEVNP